MGWVKELNLQGPPGPSWVTHQPGSTLLTQSGRTAQALYDFFAAYPDGWHFFDDSEELVRLSSIGANIRYVSRNYERGTDALFLRMDGTTPAGSLARVNGASAMQFSIATLPTDTLRVQFLIGNQIKRPVPGDVFTHTGPDGGNWVAPSITLDALKAVAAASTDFDDFKTQIASMT